MLSDVIDALAMSGWVLLALVWIAIVALTLWGVTWLLPAPPRRAETPRVDDPTTAAMTTGRTAPGPPPRDQRPDRSP